REGAAHLGGRRGVALARDRVDGVLRRAVFHVGGNELHGEQRDDDEDEQPHDQPADGYSTLHVLHCPASRRHAQRKDPKRPSSFRLSQMKNALPTMLPSGTNPHTRLSLELSRVSPITNSLPG